LAVVAQPIWNQEAILARPDILGQYGEQIQDPTNVGTTIRSAFAFGLDALWLSSDSADVFNPKVVRASAGAILKLPVFYLKDPSLLLRHRCTLYAAVSGGEQAPPLQSLTRLPDRTVVALGNESRGLSPETLAQAGACFRIPIAPDLESLNMAAAASITAFYFANLRRAGRRSSRSR
jgi:TrmH family RNA methyltransferase